MFLQPPVHFLWGDWETFVMAKENQVTQASEGQ